MNKRTRRIPSLKFQALALLAMVAALSVANLPSSKDAAASSGGLEMALDIAAGGSCAGDDCYAGIGGTFELELLLTSPPAAGYSVFQTYLAYGTYDPEASEDGSPPGGCSDTFDNDGDGARDRYDDECVTLGITYVPTVQADDEIPWPDLGTSFRYDHGPGLVYHAGLTGLIPPVPVSDYEGAVVTLTFSCPAEPVDVPVAILAFGDPFAESQGALVYEPDLTTTHVPKVDAVTVHCINKQAHPEDTDGDGCSDQDENGAMPAQGGDRDWVNPWDFYDVAGPGGVPIPDGVVDQANDMLSVISHYAPTGAPPYDEHFDRGPWTGANSWNGTQPPDGVIDLANDIYGVIPQVGHNCT